MPKEKEYTKLEKGALLIILSETEKLANVGGWEWDMIKDVWTFSDNWLLITAARNVICLLLNY